MLSFFHSLHRHMTRSDVVDDGIIDLERADIVVLTPLGTGLCVLIS